MKKILFLFVAAALLASCSTQRFASQNQEKYEETNQLDAEKYSYVDANKDKAKALAVAIDTSKNLKEAYIRTERDLYFTDSLVNHEGKKVTIGDNLPFKVQPMRFMNAKVKLQDKQGREVKILTNSESDTLYWRVEGPLLNSDLHKYSMNDSVWSDQIKDYVHYSRIDMGRRMNHGIDYNKRATNQMWWGTGSLVAGGVFFGWAAWGDPAVRVATTKYDQDYFDKAKEQRTYKVIAGSAFSGLACYLYWRAFKNMKKSRWMISPDGLRYPNVPQAKYGGQTSFLPPAPQTDFGLKFSYKF